MLPLILAALAALAVPVALLATCRTQPAHAHCPGALTVRQLADQIAEERQAARSADTGRHHLRPETLVRLARAA